MLDARITFDLVQLMSKHETHADISGKCCTLLWLMSKESMSKSLLDDFDLPVLCSGIQRRIIVGIKYLFWVLSSIFFATIRIIVMYSPRSASPFYHWFSKVFIALNLFDIRDNHLIYVFRINCGLSGTIQSRSIFDNWFRKTSRKPKSDQSWFVFLKWFFRDWKAERNGIQLMISSISSVFSLHHPLTDGCFVYFVTGCT